MLSIESSGSFKNTDSFLRRCMSDDLIDPAEQYAEMGVQRLADYTPKESGLTASSWSYEISYEGGGVTIWWRNSHEVEGFNVAVGLAYGHGTGTGGWVPGSDYIKDALQPIFDLMDNAVWKEVQRP